jgi:hypothetical protein
MNYLRFVLFLLLLPSYSYSTNKINYLEPIPGAKLVSTNNNIIIGFENPIVLNEQDILYSINVLGSESMRHDGNVIITSDKKKIIFNPSIPFNQGEEISVMLSGKLLKTLFPNKQEYSYSFTTSPKKISWDALKSFKDELSTARNSFNNSDLQLSFPTLTVTINNNPSPGDIFISNYHTTIYAPYLIITDKNGLPYWDFQLAVDCNDFKEQPNGHLSYYDVGSYEHLEMDINYNIINSYHCGNGYLTDGHEFRLLNSGYSYVMAYDPETVDMSQYVAGGDTNATVVGLIIQELDPNKNVVFQWRSWDHFNITDAWHQNMYSSYIDCVHGNAIEIDNDSNLIISSRHLDEITKINQITGDIIWRFGGKNNQFTFLGDTLKFTYQHAIRRISNGNVTLYDNGNFHTPHFSRAVEYSLDEVNKTATEVWEYRHSPNIYGNAMGYVQRLSNGNTLIGWGMTNPSVTEVKPDGTIAFEMSLPAGVVSYRAYKFDWNGSPLAIGNEHNKIPSSFELNQNYPNPFNPSTKINYQIASAGNVKLSVYDVLGKEVQVLLDQKQNPGIYQIVWNASNFPSGVYFYKLQTGSFTETRKMMLIK